MATTNDLKNLINKMIDSLSDEQKEGLIRSLNDSTEEQPPQETKKKKFRRKNKKQQETSQGGENLFEQSPVFNQFKSDIAVDKKLSGNSRPSERRDKERLVKVNCLSCGKEDEVESYLLFKDEGVYRYKCNRCSVGGRR